EKPKALRRRATFRSRAPLAARSAICAATALDVNGDHDTSPVAGHAATEVSPPIQDASPRLVPPHWLDAHGVISLACKSNRAQVSPPLHPRGHIDLPKSARYCLAGTQDAVPPNLRVRRRAQALLW